MVEFSNETNYSYILNNDTLSSNKTTKYKIQKNIFSFTFKDFIILLIDLFMIIGPSFGYFLQSLKFKKKKSSKGFSKSIVLIIFITHILRVFFWIGKPFKITLLYQSILILIFQIYLIHLWVIYHDTDESNENGEKNQNKITEFNIYEKKELIEYLIDWSDTISPNKIWNWTSEIEYYKFMWLIILILLIISGVIGIHNVYLTNIYGTISVVSETSTLVPQIIVSFKKKNASNLSTTMVILWLIGEVAKFIYNIKYRTPIQMIISGGVQVFLEFFFLMQIFWYRNKNKFNKMQSSNNVEISTTIKSKQVQQINQFMNKLEEIQKSDESENHQKDSNKKINKIEVVDRTENSDKVEVLDKSKEERVKYSDDEEDNNNNHHELQEEEIKKDNENSITVANLKFEGDNEIKIDDN